MTSKTPLSYILKFSKLAAQSKQPFKSVVAKRKVVRNLASLNNYFEGNGIIDWLIKHPETVDIKFLPAKLDLKFNLTSVSCFYDEIKKASKLYKTKMLETSEYASETILAMRQGYDIIFNCTLVYRPLERKVKINMLIKSSTINKIFNTKYNCNASSIHGNFHYIPVVLKSTDNDKIDVLTLNAAQDILHKYQNFKPIHGYIINDKLKFTPVKYNESSNEIISQGLNWLNMIDSLDKDTEISANAKISSDSPWFTAVKQISLEQENMSMLKGSNDEPDTTFNFNFTYEYTDWKSIDEASKKHKEWAENYYSSTGCNMKIFKEIMNNSIIINSSELDDKIYQCSILNTDTNELVHFQDEHENMTETCLDKLKEYLKDKSCKVLSWSHNLALKLNVLDLKLYFTLNAVKFPYSCNDDLDFIALRALKDSDYNKLPIINFSLKLVAKEFYLVKPDYENQIKLKNCMKDACIRPLLILSYLKKMTVKL